jgi:PAS domain S-box-containing protein
MALTPVPSFTTDVSQLKRRVLDLRVIAYSLSTAGASAVAIGTGSDQATILAVLAGVVLAFTIGFRSSVGGRLEVCLTIDAGGAAALWWLFGPVAAVDFVLFYVIASAALLLPRVTALRIAGALLLVLTSQILFHLPAIAPTLQLFHPGHGVGPVEEIITRVILVVGTAIMFFTIARMFQRSQAATVESEQRFRSLVEASPDAIVVHNGSEVLFANPAASQLIGTDTPEEMLGTAVWGFVHPDSVSLARSRADRALRGENVEQTELMLTRRDGRVIHVEAIDIPALFDSKPAAQVVLRDITERHAALQALQESEERYKGFFEGIPTPLYRTTPDGRILDANAALVSLLGYPDKQSLLARDAGDSYVRPGDRAANLEALHRQGSLGDYEQELIRHDGTHIWVRETSRVVFNSDGSVLYYEGAMVDITEGKRAEEMTRRLIRILEATPDYVAIADEDGNFLYGNQSFRDFAGVSEGSQLRDMKVRDILGVDAEDSLTDILQSEVWNGVLTLRPLNGSGVPASTVVINHRDEHGKIEYFSAVARDISDRIAAEARLEQLIRSKDDFVASVSHELRTPLAAVVGLTQELRDNRASFTPQEMAEFISLIADQSSEVANIVEDLLVAARAEIGKIVIARTVIHVGDEIAAVLAAIGLADSARISVDVDETAGAWADAARLRQILRNLITNAVRYGGGNIGLMVRRCNGSVVITVNDDGPGIPEDKRESVFQPYERAHSEGTQPASVGLGLTVSRQLARLMDGDLIYRGGTSGSSFELSLPCDDR